jgi:hypothetical protein
MGKTVLEPKGEPDKRPHSDAADMKAMAFDAERFNKTIANAHEVLRREGFIAQPGSPNFEGGAAYEDYQVHSAPWVELSDKLHSARVALMAAEATLALCAGKVPPYVEDRRAETVAIVRASLKELGE